MKGGMSKEEIDRVLSAPKRKRGRPAHPVTQRIRHVLSNLRDAGLIIRVNEVVDEVKRITPFDEFPDYRDLLTPWLRTKVRSELKRKSPDGIRLYVSWADKLGIARQYVPTAKASAAILGRHAQLDRDQAKVLSAAATHYTKIVNAFDKLGPDATVEEVWEEAFSDDEALVKLYAAYPDSEVVS